LSNPFSIEENTAKAHAHPCCGKTSHRKKEIRMSNDINQLMFTGNLMADPSMRYTPAGAPVTTLIIACNNSFKTQAGTTVETVVKFKVSAWNKLAETCNQFLHKGDQVAVVGRLTTAEQEGSNRGSPHIWQAQDGTIRADHEVKLETIKFLQKAKSNTSTAIPASTTSAGERSSASEDEYPY
jgi:single-strand DNA-binding protein